MDNVLPCFLNFCFHKSDELKLSLLPSTVVSRLTTLSVSPSSFNDSWLKLLLLKLVPLEPCTVIFRDDSESIFNSYIPLRRFLSRLRKLLPNSFVNKLVESGKIYWLRVFPCATVFSL